MQIKKILAIFLAAALIFSATAVTAVAENNEIFKVGVEVISSAPIFSSSAPICCGDEITVRVSVDQNTGVSYLRTKLDFNNDYFELIEIKSNKLFGSGETIKTFSDYVEYYINYSTKNVSETGILFDIKFKVKENVCGDANFVIALSQNGNPRNCCYLVKETGALTPVPFEGDTVETLVHLIDYDNPTVKEETCTEDGYTRYICNNEGCEYYFNVDVKEKLGHVINTLVIKPTCFVDGYTLDICNRCDYYEKYDFVSAGHTYQPTVTEPTCTDAGYTTYICSGCNDSYIDDATEATGHNYEPSVTAPTCTEEGYTTYICSKCNDSYIDDATEATGHNYEPSVTAPTCTDDGYTTHTCTVCEHSYTDSKTDALGHNYDSVVTDPTCTDGGYTTHTCTVCEHSYTDSKTDALGHTAGDAVEENRVEANCTNNGSYDTVTYCTVCEAELERVNNVINAIGHINGETVTENTIAPTCTENGSHDDVVYCTVCNTEVSRTNVTDNALGHKESEAVVENRVESTCTVAGSYENVIYCSACNAELSKVKQFLELKDHAYVDHDAKAPTCTDIGWDAYRTCADCDYTEYSEKSALGHTWGETVVILPEYNKDGYSEHTCTVCKLEEKFDYTDALTYMLGDVDANEVVDSDDAVYLLYYTFYPEDFPINQLGDFDGNGVVDSDDAVYLLYYTFYPEDFPLFDMIVDVEMGGDEV